jgi:hypothetical protein
LKLLLTFIEDNKIFVLIEKPFFVSCPNIVAAYLFYWEKAVDKEICQIFISLRNDVCVLENPF